MHYTCHGRGWGRKQEPPIRGASKGEIANGCCRDSDGITKFDLAVHASILLHIVAHFVS
jgi:hypothetical protein